MTNTHLHPIALFAFFVSLSCFSGCGGSAGSLRGLAPCKGTVTLDGVPLSDALVMFIPVDGGEMRAASAQTDASGGFTMSTLQPQDGVTPGKFAVTVVKHEEFGPAPKTTVNEAGEEFTPAHPTRNILPAKYASKGTSGIEVTIDKSGNKNVKIELTK